MMALFNFGRFRALYIYEKLFYLVCFKNLRHCTFFKFGYIHIVNDIPILPLHDIINFEIKLPEL